MMTSRIVSKSVLSKKKTFKNVKKLKKVSKPLEFVKSPIRVTKKKKPQTKTEKLKPNKEILKETLKNLENGDSSKLYKKINKSLEKVAKSKEDKQIQEIVKKKNKEIRKKVQKLKSKEIKEIPKKIQKLKSKEIKENTQKLKKPKSKEIKESSQKLKKQKSKETKGTPQKLKKQKSNETEEISQKLKKQKNLREQKEEIPAKKKQKKLREPKEEPAVENREPLQLSPKQIKQGVAAVLKLAKDQKSNKNLMDEENSPIFLQVCCMKIPKIPTQQLRMLLPHSLVSPDDDVALIVKDLQKGRRRDYEPTVEHYQQFLQERKCTQVKTIIPVNQIKTEYDQFELKRNLVFSYDHFLIDGRVSGHVARLLGKIFTKRRKLPTSIRIGSKDLKHEIDYALRKTSMKLNSNGDTHIVQIGTTSMPKSEIVENIEAVCKSLAKNFPGGWSNIRSLRIKTPTNFSIPIYMTLKSKNTVVAPDIKPKRPKAHRTFEGELTTVDENATVTVHPDGTVTVKNEVDSVNEDEEIKEEDEEED